MEEPASGQRLADAPYPNSDSGFPLPPASSPHGELPGAVPAAAPTAPLTRAWQQPLPDTDARGVAHPPGPIEPGQRRSRITQENAGDHKAPGERTNWIGRHHKDDD
jgi:hypothetical protein